MRLVRLSCTIVRSSKAKEFAKNWKSRYHSATRTLGRVRVRNPIRLKRKHKKAKEYF